MKKILIVEDDNSVAELVRLFLEQNDYEVLVERNGLNILEVARKIHPDLILLDAVLPEMDGRTVQKMLYNDSETSKIPIIMMTAYSQLEQAFADKENVAGFIVKPFNNDELRRKIREALKR